MSVHRYRDPVATLEPSDWRDPPLPVDAAVPDLVRALGERGVAVLEAPPGSGKTTRLPLHLLDAPWCHGRRILIAEPRRLAARAAAARMAHLLGEKVGETVGYAMRFERRLSAATRIEVVTEGLLLRRLEADPGLEAYALVVLDEFHERSLDADLGLALLREARAHLNPSLRLLVMSATLDGAGVAAFLDGAPRLRAEGRAYPVTVQHRPAAAEADAAAAVQEALRRHGGGVLVFLPGAAEIERAATRLRGALPADVDLHRLYGARSPAEQNAAVAPPAPGRRKVVLATDIAETSLTIEGIAAVVDAGLQRRPVYSPRTGMNRFVTRSISQASATQRAGRAGRVAPGHAYRLWDPLQARHAAEPPEIMEADLAGLVLVLAGWGVRAVSGIAWLTRPPGAAFAEAQGLLRRLNALDIDGRLTPHGGDLLGLPLHPRLGHMVIEARKRGFGAAAAAVAALLAGHDPFRDAGVDLTDRLKRRAGAPWPGEAARIEAQVRRAAGVARGTIEPDAAGRCLALAYPERVAVRRGNGYKTALGRGVRLPPGDRLGDNAYLAFGEVEDSGSDALARLAAPLEEAEVEALFAGAIVEEVSLDLEGDAVVARRVRRLGRAVLTSTPAAISDWPAAHALLLAELRRRGPGALPWPRGALALRRRLAFLAGHRPDLVPPFDDQALLDGLEAWLLPYLTTERDLAGLGRLDLEALLRYRLDRNAAAALDRLAPAVIESPAGSRIGVDYAGEPPAYPVRLQEMFGTEHTPAVLDGAVPLTLHLLSPAGRPLAVTQDLASFWQNAYPDVRKEGRGRYPKHPWPDDPLTARPWRPGTLRVR